MNHIILLKYTDQGIKNIKESPNRVKKAKELFHKLGAEVKDFYFLMGQYDLLFIVQASNDTVIAECVLALGSLGNVRSETLLAFNESEFSKICSDLP
ncbi:MAG: GYD domain-containing protein [Proteobacteria bacterium]|nr:GYD domain-containing protein [Pseudomonadota bacterium]